MRFRNFRRTHCVLVAVTTILSVTSAHAGPFEDLLFGRRNDYYYPGGAVYAQSAPVATYYAPTTTAYQSATNQTITTNFAPVGVAQSAPITVQRAAATNACGCNKTAVAATSYYAPPPTTVYAPAVPGCGCGQQRVVAAFPPAPNYRTVYYRVPVTSFRPVTAYDAATCSQVTTLQPCTTYGWQARRVPTTRHPFLSWIFHRRGTARATPIYPYDSCASPVITAGESTTISAPGTVIQGTQVPADVAPSLDPNSYSPQSGASFNGGAFNGGAISGGAINGGAINGGVNNGDVNGTFAYPSDSQPPNTESFESARPPLDAIPDESIHIESESNTSGSTNGESSEIKSNTRGEIETDSSSIKTNKQNMTARSGRPNPVPDPSRTTPTRKRFAPPRLINPRDRRASTGPAPGSFVLISWPDGSQAEPKLKPAHEQGGAAPAKANKTQPRKDSGWRAAR